MRLPFVVGLIGRNAAMLARRGALAVGLCGVGFSAAAQIVFTQVPNVSTLQTTDYSADTDIYLLGYYNAGDGGQGYLHKNGTGCTGVDNGLLFKDNGSPKNCWYRALPVSDVRQWGAKCDVQVLASPGNVAWNGGGGTGSQTLTITDSVYGKNPHIVDNDFIVVSQIGGPSVDEQSGASPNAVWATKASALANLGSGYTKGDVVSFDGGTFSQQVTIVVDSTGSGGAIADWHFLWGGLYVAPGPTGPLAQSSFSSTTGMNATLSPVWSGWSIMNNTPFYGGSGYTVGDVLAVNTSGGVFNGTQPEIVVEAVVTTPGPTLGQVTAFDWVSYGSFSTLPTATQVMSTAYVVGSGGSGFTVGSGSSSPTYAYWTRGPLATQLPSGSVSDVSGVTTVTLPAGTSGYPGQMQIQSVYYTDWDDGGYINTALQSKVSTEIDIPAKCGTTVPMVLPSDTSGSNANPALVGRNFVSTGLYAFAYPNSARYRTGTGAHPVLSRLIYKDTSASYGGGVRNLAVEGGGLPQGSGFFGLYKSGATYPTGYVGPPPTTSTPYPIPTAGDVVEIDGGKYMRFGDIYIEDALGSGNSLFHCSFDEANPNGASSSNNANGDVGNITFANSRLDQSLVGATNPSFAIKIENNCHDSVYENLSAYDGARADLFLYNGNVFSRIHVNSDAANSSPKLGSVDWSNANRWPLAGIADYGVYTIGNTSLSQTQCNVATIACVKMNVKGGSGNPGQVSDTQVKCGSYVSVAPSFFGIEVPAAAAQQTIAGTAAASGCNVPPIQLIHLDGPLDPSVTICNNSNATVVSCGTGQRGFAAGQYYTQIGSSYTTQALTANTLYAVPFIAPVGGTISKFSVDVPTAPMSGVTCELGIYNSVNGLPGTLYFDAGAMSIAHAFSGIKTISSANVFLISSTP